VLHDNLINCLHLMILQDIHTNKAVKFSSRYLNTVTEVRGGQDGNQTSFGEISLLLLSVFVIDHKYSSQEYGSSAWKVRHRDRQTNTVAHSTTA